MERWATFDCYGTLIDWDGGIRRELERVFGAARGADLLARYHQVEPTIQAEDPFQRRTRQTGRSRRSCEYVAGGSTSDARGIGKLGATTSGDTATCAFLPVDRVVGTVPRQW